MSAYAPRIAAFAEIGLSPEVRRRLAALVTEYGWSRTVSLLNTTDHTLHALHDGGKLRRVTVERITARIEATPLP